MPKAKCATKEKIWERTNQIFELLYMGYKQEIIADMLGIKRSMVADVVRGKYDIHKEEKYK